MKSPMCIRPPRKRLGSWPGDRHRVSDPATRVFAFDSDLAILSWNRAAEDIDGRPRRASSRASLLGSAGRPRWSRRPRLPPGLLDRAARARKLVRRLPGARHRGAQDKTDRPRLHDRSRRWELSALPPRPRPAPGTPSAQVSVAHGSAAGGTSASGRRRPCEDNRDSARDRRSDRKEPHSGDPHLSERALPARGNRERPSLAPHRIGVSSSLHVKAARAGGTRRWARPCP